MRMSLRGGVLSAVRRWYRLGRLDDGHGARRFKLVVVATTLLASNSCNIDFLDRDEPETKLYAYPASTPHRTFGLNIDADPGRSAWYVLEEGAK